MSLDLLAWMAFAMAAIPFGLFVHNLLLYARLPKATPESACEPVSVLIPARNEAANIADSLRAVLGNRGVEFEVVVLDDHSQDSTASIVSEFARQDSRVRLAHAPALPEGWCGKQHACHVMAGIARHEVLVFIDADVRLKPDALARMSRFLRDSGSDLISGVPRQVLGSFSERLLIPFIHSLLLGFLPIVAMRRFKRPSLSAGCGQLFVADAAAYRATGGHSAIRNSLHDGLKLPRLFRKAGFKSDLFDATDVAACRMYHNDIETWRGLGKNATEGLAAPGTLVPMSLLLLGGQVLPYVLLLFLSAMSQAGQNLVTAAVAFAGLPRLVAAWRFHLPWEGFLLHPFGVLSLLGIQWRAAIRLRLGRPEEWKGRFYGPASVGQRSCLLLLCAALLAGGIRLSATDAVPRKDSSTRPVPPTLCPPIALSDQYEHPQSVVFPTNRVVILTVADRTGNDFVDPWVQALKQRYAGRVEIVGVADLSGVPGFLKGMVRRRFQKARPHPVMMDWDGAVTRSLAAQRNKPNVYVIDQSGRICGAVSEPMSDFSLNSVIQVVESLLPAAR